jgi:hypothetical protein
MGRLYFCQVNCILFTVVLPPGDTATLPMDIQNTGSKDLVSLADFLERVKGFELASDGPWEQRKALHVLGPSRLPLRFASGQRADPA